MASHGNRVAVVTRSYFSARERDAAACAAALVGGAHANAGPVHDRAAGFA
jgi:hypothetical protein